MWLVLLRCDCHVIAFTASQRVAVTPYCSSVADSALNIHTRYSGPPVHRAKEEQRLAVTSRLDTWADIIL